MYCDKHQKKIMKYIAISISIDKKDDIFRDKQNVNRK